MSSVTELSVGTKIVATSELDGAGSVDRDVTIMVAACTASAVAELSVVVVLITGEERDSSSVLTKTSANLNISAVPCKTGGRTSVSALTAVTELDIGTVRRIRTGSLRVCYLERIGRVEANFVRRSNLNRAAMSAICILTTISELSVGFVISTAGKLDLGIFVKDVQASINTRENDDVPGRPLSSSFGSIEVEFRSTSRSTALCEEIAVLEVRIISTVSELSESLISIDPKRR
jgi:hypothetical protein